MARATISCGSRSLTTELRLHAAAPEADGGRPEVEPGAPTAGPPARAAEDLEELLSQSDDSGTRLGVHEVAAGSRAAYPGAKAPIGVPGRGVRPAIQQAPPEA